MKRRKKALFDAKNKIRAEVTSIADNLRSKIKNAGSDVASKIVEGITEDEAKRNLADAQTQAEADIAACQREIVDRLASICEETGNELSLIDNSAFAQKIRINLPDIPKPVPIDEPNLGDLTKQADTLSNVARTSGAAAKQTIFGMNSAEIVKEVGHFFGFKFAPWGAVNFVKYLGWIGAALTIFSAIKDILTSDDERRKMEDDLRKAREQIQSDFDSAAENVHAEFIKLAEEQIETLTKPVLDDAENKLADFQNKESRLQSLGNSLQKILGEVNALMNEVQKTAQA